MIKAGKFRISDKPYAVDVGSYRLADGHGRGEMDAVWFRRRRVQHNGPIRTVACAGRLWDYQTPRQETGHGFLRMFEDGRYGGDCLARWDGANLWSLADEAERSRYKGILVPMLAAYPEVPPGYDGWWVFPR